MSYSLFDYNPETGEYGYKGDSGGMSSSIYFNFSETKIRNDAAPTVGESIQVGSLYARTMSSQDWWVTTPVEEILEEFEDDDAFNVKFKTKSGSYYHWKKYK